MKAQAITKILTVALCCLPVVSCSPSKSDFPSDQQLIEIIRESKGYPKIRDITISGPSSGPFFEELERVVKDNKDNNRERPTVLGDYDDRFSMTLYQHPMRWPKGKWISVGVNTHSADVSEITDVLIDSEKGVATVTYLVTTSALPLLEEFLALDEEVFQKRLNGSHSKRYLGPKEEKIFFRKWDQGWRLLD